MAEKRRKFEPEFREGAVRIVTETGKTVAEVAKDLGRRRATTDWTAYLQARTLAPGRTGRGDSGTDPS
ncbi:transposase [Streptomyces sp. LZ34]